MTKTTTGDRLQELPLLKQGTVVSGRFTIKRFLAEGGMGRVYVAEQQPMGRKVALKVMRRDLADDKRAVKRFFQEAVAISKLNHPNTITLFDYGKGEDGSLFIAMEFLDGLTLKEIVAHYKRLSVEKTARIIAQIGLSLAEAHRKGVIHRDLKPDNVFVSEVDGQSDFVKVIDFGIAQLLLKDESQSRITQAGFVCGTPEYMSPEQARGEELDGRCDIYSLGVMMFEMLEGALPYTGDTPLAIVLKHQNGPVPILSDRFPQPLREFVRRLMATDPNDRPSSSEEMLRALQRALPDGLSLAGLDVRLSLPSARNTLPAATSRGAGGALGSSGGPDTAEIAGTLSEGSRESIGEQDEGTEEIVKAAKIRRRRGMFGLSLLLAVAIVVVLILPDRGSDTPDGHSDQTHAGITEVDGPALDGAQAQGRTSDGTGEPVGALDQADVGSTAPLSMTIMSVPELARVHVDNVYIGVAPVSVELQPDASFELLLTLDGFQDYRTTLSAGIASDGETLGPFELLPTPAHIEISSRPLGAEVVELATGDVWGVTPLYQVVPRSTEPIEVELRMSRYQSERREIVPEREQIAIEVELRRTRRSTPREDPPDSSSEQSNQSPFGGTVD